MTNDTLLFAAAQLKKYCNKTNCNDCIFVQKIKKQVEDCRVSYPQYWDIDDITGENH